jgi:hypothetical protein
MRSLGRSTASASRTNCPHSGELMPCIALVASSRQWPPWAATTVRRAWSHNCSESTTTPSRSNTTAPITSTSPGAILTGQRHRERC